MSLSLSCNSQHTGFSSWLFYCCKSSKDVVSKGSISFRGANIGLTHTQTKEPRMHSSEWLFDSVAEAQWVRHRLSIPSSFWGSTGKWWTHVELGAAGFLAGWGSRDGIAPENWQSRKTWTTGIAGIPLRLEDIPLVCSFSPFWGGGSLGKILWWYWRTGNCGSWRQGAASREKAWRLRNKALRCCWARSNQSSGPERAVEGPAPDTV